jgi:hypothetical protein
MQRPVTFGMALIEGFGRQFRTAFWQHLLGVPHLRQDGLLFAWWRFAALTCACAELDYV